MVKTNERNSFQGRMEDLGMDRLPKRKLLSSVRRSYRKEVRKDD
jgi:hypothetical protein